MLVLFLREERRNKGIDRDFNNNRGCDIGLNFSSANGDDVK